MSFWTGKKKGEEGAYAVLFAILAVFLIGMAALAVDLGNAVARKTDVQGSADFAALAAGSKLPSTPPANGTLSTVAAGDSAWMAVVDDARDFLNQNNPQNNDCADDDECVTSDDLLDHNPLNGEVLFAHEYTGMQGSGPARCAESGLCVIAPPDNVDYGLAGVLGFDDIDVQADATVGIFSAMGAMPVYAVDGCDWGRQTITDPANGQLPPPPVPTLLFPTDDNGASLTSGQAFTLTANQSGQTITFTGSKFDHVTKVGFFNPDPAGLVEVTLPSVVDSNPATSITVTVPSSVTSVSTVWYLRVYSGAAATNAHKLKWSLQGEAIPVRVGEAVLECDAGSNDGNFGTLLLERSDVNSVNDQLAMNMATNLQEPLSLAIHTGADDTGRCSEGTNGAVTSGLPNPGLRAGTNCVDTDTGLPANAATMGLVTGVGGELGRLDQADTTSGCDPNGGSAERSITIQGDTYHLNNDILTCFLTNGTTSLQDISQAGYNGGPVLDESIYDSPRLIIVPVLAVDPSTGGSDNYSIIGFRPAFITDEVVLATTIKGTHTASGDNGVSQVAQDIKQIKVVFFNIDALPPRLDGHVYGYLGVGPKILRLID